MENPKSLNENREAMEQITEKMMALFDERQDLSRAIAENKKLLGRGVRDIAREEELVRKYAGGDVRKERLLRLLFDLSAEAQEDELKEWNAK